MENKLDLLPTATKADGALRRVGIEFEFAGLELEEATEVLTASLGGAVSEANAASQSVEIDDLGEFIVEVDWEFLKRLSEHKEVPDIVKETLSRSATALVPIEIVCPPLTNPQLQKLETLIVNLRKEGAKGTEESLFYAFGLHINVELPALDEWTLDRYIKAYALLQTWLLERNAIDLSRRLTPYVDLYPDEYLVQAIQRDNPTMTQIFADYLEYNPTRNRAMDLLPLLAHIDEERVRDSIDDKRIKPRPAFHYRLPDCRIDNPEWSLAEPWAFWRMLEKLADNQDLLEFIRSRALEEKNGNPMLLQQDWNERIDEWLIDQESV